MAKFWEDLKRKFTEMIKNEVKTQIQQEMAAMQASLNLVSGKIDTVQGSIRDAIGSAIQDNMPGAHPNYQPPAQTYPPTQQSPQQQLQQSTQSAQTTNSPYTTQPPTKPPQNQSSPTNQSVASTMQHSPTFDDVTESYFL